MAATTVYAVAAYVGDGSPGNPRRATMWGRIDNVLEVIATGDVCMKPDGTVDMALVSQINATFPTVADFGPCGIVAQTMLDTTWEMIEAQLLAFNGYVVYGNGLAELKQSAHDAMTLIESHLTPAGIVLSGNGTILDQVREWLAVDRPDVFDTDTLQTLRSYYVNRLTDVIAEELPTEVYSGNALAGDKFVALRDSWSNTEHTQIGWMVHELYDLACFDLVTRNLS